jgi:hemerythrin-like domain-containing protein
VTNDLLTRFAEEHRATLRALERLEAAAEALAQGDAPASALRAVGEVCAHLTSAVRRHYDNEERALFGQIAEEAPVTPFVDEHRTLRRLEAELEAALNGPTPDQDVPPVAQSLVALLRAHIEREDQILFPMAREILGPEGLAEAARLLR